MFCSTFRSWKNRPWVGPLEYWSGLLPHVQKDKILRKTKELEVSTEMILKTREECLYVQVDDSHFIFSRIDKVVLIINFLLLTIWFQLVVWSSTGSGLQSGYRCTALACSEVHWKHIMKVKNPLVMRSRKCWASGCEVNYLRRWPNTLPLQ